jgi:hypothetical protein
MTRPPPPTAPDCGRMLREVLARFGGKGGGQPQGAQGECPIPPGSPRSWRRCWPRRRHERGA